MEIKLAVIGSRTFTDEKHYEILKKTLDEIHTSNKIVEIVSGSAIGADSLARRYSLENHIPLVEYKPKWDEYGKSAGFMRNTDIINHCDKVVAFWDGKSHGTKDSIEKAKKYNKPIFIVYF